MNLRAKDFPRQMRIRFKLVTVYLDGIEKITECDDDIIIHMRSLFIFLYHERKSRRNNNDSPTVQSHLQAHKLHAQPQGSFLLTVWYHKQITACTMM